jgi:MFS family permease
MQTSLIVLHAPPHIRSRLMGLLTVCIGMGPLGILLIGVLADHFGPLLAVDIMAITGLLAVSAIGLIWRQTDLRQAVTREAGLATKD